jgi:hypothetical protein
MAWQWLSQRGPLPLLLAGPILRRVEPGLISVWVATSSAQNISFTVYGGGAQVASNVTGTQPDGQSTVQLGDNLFVALLTAVPASTLTPGVLYTYSLTFTAVPGGTVKQFAEAFSGTANDSLASIVYAGGASGTEAALPSFSLPPTTLNQVRIAHASCRKAGGENPDAMPLLDQAIASARTGATDADFALNRLHQLFLTGDQIYADDVADSYLAMCIDAAGWLMGARKEPAPDLLGILGPVDQDGKHTYPAPGTGWDDNSASRPLGGSTPWDPSTWPAIAARGQLVFAAGYTVTSPSTTSLDPVKLRGDAKHHKLARNHLMALGEFYAAFLLAWSPVLWCPGTPDWPVPLPYDQKNLGSLVTSGSASPDDDAPDVAFFGAGIPKVRRILANVPTYMICDDHDVTDDWFINRLWCERVLNLTGDTLGRRMVRNALITFAVFQAWGNRPDLFDPAASGPPLGAQLLAQLAAGKEMTDDLTTSSATTISSLVGMPDPLGSAGPALHRPVASIPWNYRWGPSGWPYEVIVLDCRTLRRYGPGEIQPAQLLDDGSAGSSNPDQFQAQLGPAAPAGTVTLVVVQTPVLGVRFIEDRLQRTSNVKTAFEHDAESWSLSDNGYQLMLARLAAHNPMVVLMSGDVHYSFAASADFWATTPWGAGSRPAGQPLTGRVVQLNSSAARNETFLTRDLLHYIGFSLLMQASETWAGFQKPPPYGTMISLAREVMALPAIEKLNMSPAVLDAAEYKDIFDGVTSPPAPDWKYRIDFATGKRDNPPPFTPPGAVAVPPLTEDLAAEYLAAFVTYARAAAGTEIIGTNNVCVVTFSGQDKSNWHVLQAVLWRPDPGSGAQSIPDDVTKPSDVTRFDIPLQYGPEPTLS